MRRQTVTMHILTVYDVIHTCDYLLWYLWDTAAFRACLGVQNIALFVYIHSQCLYGLHLLLLSLNFVRNFPGCSAASSQSNLGNCGRGIWNTFKVRASLNNCACAEDIVTKYKCWANWVAMSLYDIITYMWIVWPTHQGCTHCSRSGSWDSKHNVSCTYFGFFT